MAASILKIRRLSVDLNPRATEQCQSQGLQSITDEMDMLNF